ncbi:hypothetical protein BDN72DRAFT_203127 [Pluteus cervinus]|uniref:Uncharacterized protein n=1 Tax=Pluteus cervinus TaxID=181527 RepID=A0ACD3AHM1_9AGAR|nr:hypothetical protein BDN72DRAFT_203127 [Pluteus cervinus]
MATIEVLSQEVLHNIFHLGTQDDSGFALKISHVCSLWRGIAHSSSDLWAYVAVKNNIDNRFSDTATFRPNTSPSRKPQPLRKFARYLKLSKARPLHVDVTLSMPPIDARNDETNIITDTTYSLRIQSIACLLVPHFDRICTLKVSCDSYSSVYTFFEALDSETAQMCHQLRDCDIEWTGPLCAVENFPRTLSRNHEISMLDKSGELDTFPNLRRLRLCGVSVDWSNFSPSHLKELSISNIHEDFRPPFQILRSILIANQDTLQTLSLLGVGRPTDAEILTFDLPNVHTLEIGYEEPEHLHAIVSSMSLPLLKNLTVRNMKGRRGGMIEELSFPGITDPYFLRTNELFEKFTAKWDFSKLEHIKLVDIEFMDDNIRLPNPVEYPDLILRSQSTSDGWRYDRRWKDISAGDLPLKFWDSCRNVKDLVLERPDLATLFSLVFPSPSECVDGEATFDLPLPKLEHLGLFGMRTWTLEEFLQRRQKVIAQWSKTTPISLALTTDSCSPILAELCGGLAQNYSIWYAKAV